MEGAEVLRMLDDTKHLIATLDGGYSEDELGGSNLLRARQRRQVLEMDKPQLLTVRDLRF